MLKCEIKQNMSKPGGRTEEKIFNLEIPEEALALLAKNSPVFEKAMLELVSKMVDETSRHNKAWEQLERDRFEHQVEMDKEDRFWKDRAAELEAERDSLREKCQQQDSELWDYQHGLKKPEEEVKFRDPVTE